MLLAFQYETGLRFEEIQLLRIRHVEECDFGFLIRVPDGKTETSICRVMPLIKYQGLLKQYLSLYSSVKPIHLDPKNLNAYSFPRYDRGRFNVLKPFT